MPSTRAAFLVMFFHYKGKKMNHEMRPFQATQNRSMSTISSRIKLKAAYAPVYVALGAISLAVALGLHTAKQQFMHNPAVRLKKSRRETVPEVVEPDNVAKESEKFINNSLFRKATYVQGFRTPLNDPIHSNPHAKDLRVESLKSVGIDPAKAAEN